MKATLHRSGFRIAVLVALLFAAVAPPLQADERRVERRLQRAADMARVKDDRGALGELQAAMAEFPTSGRPYAARGHLHDSRQRTDLAAADFDRAVELSPTDPAVRRTRGDFRHRQRDYTGAEEDFTAAIAAAPRDLDLVRRRAELRLDRGDYVGALADADAVRARRRQDPEIRALRALLLVFLDHTEEGMQELRWLVRSFPNNPNAYRFRANARAAAGEVDGALTDYSRALQLAAPEERAAYAQRLAFLLFAAGNLPRALEVFESLAARERDPNAIAIERLARGLILRRMERPDESRAILQEGLAAVETSPDRFADLYALIYRVALGSATERELMLAIPDPLGEPEAYCLTRFFAAQIRISRDDLVGAREHLREATLTGRRHLLEWQAARATLEAFLPPEPETNPGPTH